MNDSIQKQLAKAEDEIKALKAIFDKNATSLPIFTKTINFSTQENRCEMILPGTSPYQFSGGERVIVEFITTNGINTIADLEYTWSRDDLALPKCRRVPFNGGVAWEINGDADIDLQTGNWKATTYNFTVNSVVDGNLRARMIWQ